MAALDYYWYNNQHTHGAKSGAKNVARINIYQLRLGKTMLCSCNYKREKAY